jgi:putative methionine-R-sulfoxide reductase with GAF domain
VPFKVGGTNAGLLNIDCREEKKFNPKDHQFIATLFADCVAMIIEMQQLREELQA